MTQKPFGLGRNASNYGDPAFALYLRRSFAKSMGYTGAALDKPIVGICTSESGFNNCHRHFPEMIEAVNREITIPLVASGGAGNPEHLRAAFAAGADAALAASIFHYGEYSIPATKQYLAEQGIPVRLV